MYCKECGKQIPENSKFCPFCGDAQFIDPLAQNTEDVPDIVAKEIDAPLEESEEYSKEDGTDNTSLEHVSQESNDASIKKDALSQRDGTKAPLPPKKPMDPKKKKYLLIGAACVLAAIILASVFGNIFMDKRPIEEVFAQAVSSDGANLPQEIRRGKKLAGYNATSDSWNEEYAPMEKRASVAGEVGGIVIVTEATKNVGYYQNSDTKAITGTARKWVLTVKIVDPYTWKTLSMTTLSGSNPPQRAYGSATGTKPGSEDVAAWVDKNWPQ